MNIQHKCKFDQSCLNLKNQLLKNTQRHDKNIYFNLPTDFKKFKDYKTIRNNINIKQNKKINLQMKNDELNAPKSIPNNDDINESDSEKTNELNESIPKNDDINESDSEKTNELNESKQNNNENSIDNISDDFLAAHYKQLDRTKFMKDYKKMKELNKIIPEQIELTYQKFMSQIDDPRMLQIEGNWQELDKPENKFSIGIIDQNNIYIMGINSKTKRAFNQRGTMDQKGQLYIDFKDYFFNQKLTDQAKQLIHKLFMNDEFNKTILIGLYDKKKQIKWQNDVIWTKF